MKFLSDILAKAGLTVDGVVTLNNTATGQTPDANDNSTKLATTAWVRGFVTPYSLPIASSVTLGGIKIGSGLSIDGTGVVSITTTGTASIKSTQTFTATAAQTVFTISGGYTAGLIDVFLNGVYLSPNQTTATNGTTVTLADAASSGDIIDVIITSPIYQGSVITTDQLPEGSTNLYYTNARARAAISLTTTGTSGSATYNSSTGVLNIPSYIGGVVSIFGRTGTVVAVSGDYTTTLVTEGTNLYYTDARARAAISVTGSGSYDSATGIITITGGVTSFNTRTGAITPTSGDYTTALVTESGNLYYTDARARAAISLTTTGTSGAASYNNTTGVLNIPQYQGGVTSFNTRTGAITLTSSDVTTALTYTPVTNARTLTINGDAYDLTADRTWTIGVTPSARTIQTYTATAAQTTFTVTGGYVVGLVDVFINGVRLTSADFTATNGTTVVLTTGTGVNNIVDVIKYTSAFTATNALRQVTNFTATAGQTSFTVSYTPGLIDVFYNGSKLVASEYTASNGTTVVLANAAVLNDLLEIISYSYTVGAYSGLSTTRTLTINGTSYDLSADRTWTITNASLGAQPQLNGTGLVRMSGTTVSYDNATYATESYVTTAVANLVDAAPATLDTLNELAAALGDDPNFATTIATSIGTKQPQLNGTGFIKASGTTITYDNSTYALDSAVVKLTGIQTISGVKTFTGAGNTFTQNTNFLDRIYLKSSSTNDYTNLSGHTNQLLVGVIGATHILSFPENTNYTYTFPAASGTVAFTSNLSSYLPLSGGTLTGALSGTSATFSSSVQTTDLRYSSSGFLTYGTGTVGTETFTIRNGAASPALTIAYGGAATFSSSVTANSSIISTTIYGGTFKAYDGTNFVNFGSYFNTIGSGNSYDGVIYTTHASSALYLMTGGSVTPKLTITSGGYLGIGSNNPARILYTVGVSGGAEWVLEDTGSSINQKKFNVVVSGNKTQFRVLNDANNGGTVWLTTDNSNGFVGIGSIAPARRLTVQNAADDGTLQIRMQGPADTTSYCEIGRESASTGDFRINVSRTGTVINALRISDTTGNATFSRNIGLNGATPRNYFYSGVNNAGVNLGGYTDIFTLSNQSLYIGTNMYYDNGWFRPNTGYAAMIELVGSSGAINFYNQTTGTGGLSITPNPTMVLNGIGNLGVGTISPSGRLGVQTTGADGFVMEPDLGSVNNSGRIFFKSSVQTYGLFNNSADLRLTYDAVPGNTSGTSLARFTNTGKYFRMEAGTGGIQFGGDTAAANALDDYEEGTWTPVMTCGSGSASYAYQLGWYTKIGRVVTITWFIAFTKGSLSGGTVGLANLPFSLMGGTFYPQCAVLFDNLSTVTNNITLQGDNNAASGTFIENNGGTTDHAGLATSRLGSGTMACRGTLTYFTA
jgi:hypothetical protein